MRYWRKPLDQDRLKSRPCQVRVQKDRCKGCCFCIEFCPTHALHESAEFNRKGYHPVAADSEKCMNCGLCQLLCPEFAINVEPLEEEEAHG